MRMFLIGLCALLGASLIQSQAIAQAALTADGAQTFLAKLSEQGMLKVSRSWQFTKFGSNSYYQCNSGCPERATQTVITTGASKGACSTVIAHNPPVTTGGGNMMEYVPSYVAQFVIDWKRVTAVQRSGGSVTLLGTWPDTLGNPQFFLDTEELAIRAQKAMEFLRASCDPTGGTGF